MPNKNELEEKIDRLWKSYFYPETTTLKNKYNITDPDELRQKEAEVSFEKLVELYENPLEGNFDAEHLKRIHKYIFEDLYTWAGEYRYVDMQKETGFTTYSSIDSHLKTELNLMNEEIKTISNEYALASFLATYYAQLMAIHPFREGNGRSCREFLREFIVEKTKNLPTGPYELDWSRFDGDVMLENIQFSLVFRGAIEMEFQKALVQVNPENQIKK